MAYKMKGHTLPGIKQNKKTKLKNLSGTKSRGSVDETNLSKMSGLGPRTAFGGVKNPELTKNKAKK